MQDFVNFEKIENLVFSNVESDLLNKKMIVAKRNNEILCFPYPVAFTRFHKCQVCELDKKTFIARSFRENDENVVTSFNYYSNYTGPILFCYTQYHQNLILEDCMNDMNGIKSMQYSCFDFTCTECFGMEMLTKGFQIMLMNARTFIVLHHNPDKNNMEEDLRSLKELSSDDKPTLDFVYNVKKMFEEKLENTAPCLFCKIFIERTEACSNVHCMCGRYICVVCWKVSSEEIFHQASCSADKRWKNFIENRTMSILDKVKQESLKTELTTE
ncbi:hypothetical protein AL387_gp060 [Carp edema virus]|nr:hypothetical protein AL387_gp060 [Carp edema virus]